MELQAPQFASQFAEMALMWVAKFVMMDQYQVVHQIVQVHPLGTIAVEEVLLHPEFVLRYVEIRFEQAVKDVMMET